MVFHSYLRIEAFLYLDGVPDDVADIRMQVRFDHGPPPPQTIRFVRRHENGAFEMSLDALIDRTMFPHRGYLAVGHGSSEIVRSLADVCADAQAVNRRDALTWNCLSPAIEAITAEGRRPRLLDLGGRRRSGRTVADALDSCDVVVFDIVADAGVDVVGDAHELSRHFPPESFDLVMCNSVFEHLLMPWKVALELNAVLRPGGLCYIHTHQSIGLHDMPWDFFRYSDTAWNGLFNRRTGFEIVEARMSYFNHIVTAGWSEAYVGSEASGGFEASGVLVRKIGGTDLSWNVGLSEAIASSYPR